MPRARVLLADDHSLLLAAFETLLAPDYDIVGAVSDGRALIGAAEKLQPDVVVLDVAMPMLNGLDAAREVKRRCPRTKMVFVTMSEDPDVAAAALRLGASGYVLKRSAASELQTAIREALLGRCYVTPLVTEGAVGSLVRSAEHKPPVELTAREREVLQLLAEGRSMKQVGSVLGLTARTVAFHKYRMMDRLHIGSTAELIQFAVRQHLV